ncbi:nitroreductase family protein [Gordonia sp. CPCC 206044]|uniref:nitroreductase family protein n=1 Tax=Gordonia sp. CPCC 206044 TaxID=3140793 RepID=UPI003AF34E46
MARPSLLSILEQRWSPREFDLSHTLDEDEISVLLEAARWAPSAGNSQPWAFHAVGRRASGWDQIVECLAASSRTWASTAALLVVNICHSRVEGTDWEYSEFAGYDLGQAVAHMTIQAQSMGLSCRQFRAFDLDGLTDLLEVPDHWTIMSMTAIGRAAADARRGPGADVRDPSVTWPRE